MVVSYGANQMSAPEPAPQQQPRRKGPTDTGISGIRRSNSLQNRTAINAGRQILSSTSQRQIQTKDNVPKANEVASLQPRQQKNFVKANLNKAAFEMKPKQQAAAEEETIAGKNKNYGKVPSYLNKYNKQRDEEAKKKALDEELSKHPPGTRLMPEEERVQTLNDLNEAKAETNRQLERLPVANVSQKMERHKKELEEKMSRLDRAIETFSKKQVYVAQ